MHQRGGRRKTRKRAVGEVYKKKRIRGEGEGGGL